MFQIHFSEIEGRIMMAWADILPSFSWTAKEPVMKTIEGFLSSWLSPLVNWVAENWRSSPFNTFFAGLGTFLGVYFVGGYFWNRTSNKKDKAKADEDAKTMTQIRNFTLAAGNYDRTMTTLSDQIQKLTTGLDDNRKATVANTGAIIALSARVEGVREAVVEGFRNYSRELSEKINGLTARGSVIDAHGRTLQIIQGHTTTMSSQVGTMATQVEEIHRARSKSM